MIVIVIVGNVLCFVIERNLFKIFIDFCFWRKSRYLMFCFLMVLKFLSSVINKIEYDNKYE